MRIGAGHAIPDLSGDTALESFQRELCEFLCDAMTPERTAAHHDRRDRTGLDEAFGRALQAEAGRRGILGVSLDPAHGGAGRPATFAAVFEYEVAYHDAPLVDTALTLAGAPIVAFGTEEQRSRLLPRMLAGDVEICIAYSEPAAGNDLAAIETNAVRDGDGFVLDGRKWLITGADKADYCVTVAITDVTKPARDAMTMFIVDLSLPGVDVIAQPTMAGYDLWEIRFGDVHLGADALLGEVDGGWRQLMQAVESERNLLFNLGWCQRVFDETVRHCTLTADPAGMGTLADNPLVADRLADLWLELHGVHHLGWDPVMRSVLGSPQRPGAVGMAKVAVTELQQRLGREASLLAGCEATVEGSFFGLSPAGGVAGARLSLEYLFRFDGPVSVGANEVHRSGIGRAVTRGRR